MFSQMTSNFSQTVTEIISKGKKALYLVLKPKPLPVKIIETLTAEVQARYESYLNQKLPLLKDMKLDNPEQFYECFLLKAMIEVLKQMLFERKINLSEKDLYTLDMVFQKEIDETGGNNDDKDHKHSGNDKEGKDNKNVEMDQIKLK